MSVNDLLPLHEEGPNTDFFWSALSCAWNEYGDLLRKSSCSVRIQENTEQKKLHIRTLFMQCSLLKMSLFNTKF